MNVSKMILPIGTCHCLANKAERLIRLHLEKRDSDSDKWARNTDDTSPPVGSTQYRGGHYEHFQEQNETQKLVAHREIMIRCYLPAYHSPPNGSASEIRSTPRLSLRGRTL